MTIPNVSTADNLARTRASPSVDPEAARGPVSAVSWGAIWAGAAAAAALSLILLLLGTGLGLSSVSPWARNGVSATTLGVATILWVTLTQLLASGMGGYIAGRLRTKWVAVHTDEVYFRDTAHGFLAWAIASLASAALLTSVIGSIVSGGVQAGASTAGGVASTAAAAVTGTPTASGSETVQSDNSAGSLGYFIDSLFRMDTNAAAPAPLSPKGDPTTAQPIHPATSMPATEVSRIFLNTIHTGTLPADDVRYVGQLIVQRTGLTQQDAEQRVRDLYARAQEALQRTETAARDAADKARKAFAYTALWLFISLLIGAFVASLAATFGGRQRDLV
jgi:hypothetical protein